MNKDLFQHTILIVLSFICFQVAAQKTTFDRLSIADGLSQHSVLSITQDKSGFIWLGTLRGLNRYDGTLFNSYHNSKDSTSLSHNLINSLHYDSQGTLWVGTATALNTYNPKQDNFTRISLNKAIKEKVYIHQIYEDKKGHIWIASHNGLHLLIDRQKLIFKSFYANENGLPGDIIRSIIQDQAGTYWIATNEGVCTMQVDHSNYSFKRIKVDEKIQQNISSNYTLNLEEDSKNRIWMGTLNDGIIVYDSKEKSFVHLTHQENDPTTLSNNKINKLLLVDKKMWVGTNEGLNIFDLESGQIKMYSHHPTNKESLSHNGIFSIFVDAIGSKWVGTYFGGVNILNTVPFISFQNNPTANSISNNIISGISEDKNGNLWIGTDGGGLNYYDKKTGKFTVYRHSKSDPHSLGSDNVKKILLDSQDNLWVGTYAGGINVMDPKTKKFKKYFSRDLDFTNTVLEFTYMVEDKEGRLWVAGNTPLQVFKKNGTDLQRLDIKKILPKLTKDIVVESLFKDKDNNIWAGTKSFELYKINGGNFTQINTTSIVNCITQDADHNIWLGLHYGGIARLDTRTNKITPVNHNEQINTLNVVGLLVDDYGDLWISTNNGLVKYAPYTHTFQIYNESDGLTSNEFSEYSSFKDRDGKLFFGSFNGLISFYPDSIISYKSKPPIAFTGLKLFNRSVSINDDTHLLKENIIYTQGLVFKSNQNVFTIEFSLLSFVRSSKNKYAYKMMGYNDEWTEINTSSITFNNLPAGEYTLAVKGANNDGVWSDPIEINISVLPHPLKTTWAYFVYALLLAGIIFLIIRFFYLRALIKRDKELHENKLNFFTNVSHEIRTHLTLILSPIEIMERENPENNALRYHLANAQNYANRLLKLVSELMDFRKAESSNLQLKVTKNNFISFLSTIYTSFKEVAIKKNINFSFENDIQYPFLYFDQDQLEKVFYNLLSNAFKFTPQNGSITISLEEDTNHMVIHVLDNGKGIAADHLQKLFNTYFQINQFDPEHKGYGIGLAIAKTIVELHKGIITVESKVDTGDQDGYTKFTVRLQKGKSHFESTEIFESPKESDALPSHIESKDLPNLDKEENEYRLLVVEDNEVLRHVIKNSLPHYQISIGTNGLEGWQVAISEIPDLIITDVMMPEMDGHTLCKKIKEDLRTSHIPVLLLTAHSKVEDALSPEHQHQGDLYLTKPFKMKTLESSVKDLLISREKLRKKFNKEFLELPIDVPIMHFDQAFINKLIGHIEQSLQNIQLSEKDLASMMEMSTSQLNKKIKTLSDYSLPEFVKIVRLRHAASYLKQGLSLSDVCVRTGFAQLTQLKEAFQEVFGKDPTDFRK